MGSGAGPSDLPSAPPLEAVNILSPASLLLEFAAFNTISPLLLDTNECWKNSVLGASSRFCSCPESPPKTLIASKL